MSNSKKPIENSAPKSQHIPKYEPPTHEKVRQWVDSDLNSAIYFLSILKAHPDVLEKITQSLIEYAKKRDENPVNE